MKNGMKKALFIIISFVFLFSIAGCSSEKYEAVNKTDFTEVKEISFSEYDSKIKDKDSFVLLVWQTGCSHCESFEPKMNKIVGKYNLEVYSLNLANLSEDERTKLGNKIHAQYTPTTVYIEDGTHKNTEDVRIVGDKSEEDIINFFLNINYLKEK